MNRTHAFFSVAAALTVAAALQPATAWVRRLHQPTVHAVGRDSTGEGPLKLEAALSHLQPLEGSSVYVRYDVRADETRLDKAQQPVQLALVLDRSGSMAGEKLRRTKAAALGLVDLLGDGDQLAVVSFSSHVTQMELTRTDEGGKARLREFINQMQDSGGTNISAALAVAQQLLAASSQDAIRRVVLVSDGQPTEGVTSEEELVAMAVRLHEAKVAVTALGVGTDFNTHLMERMAERGGGYYAYLNDPARLTEVLQKELAQARGAVARNVVLKLELSPDVQLVQVAGRDVVRQGRTAQVTLQDFTPGQTAQAFVELMVPQGTGALTISAHLEYLRASTDALAQSGVAKLSANTTNDPAAAESSKDAQVTLECLRAVGSIQMVQAAAAFGRGDRASAFEFLGNARALFGMSADALAGDAAVETEKRWMNTTDLTAMRHEGAQLEKKSMRDFGKNNSY